MKRWVACKKIIVDGAYEPAVARHTDNFRAWSGSATNWMICQIGIRDLTPVLNDPDCHVIPDVSFDLQLSALSAAQRNNLKNKLEALGVTNYTDVSLQWTIREFLTWLGNKLQPRMNPEAGDVADF